MNRVTIQDIAKELQLSRNTVAKAFNDGSVSQETKQMVLQKAWEMGYGKLTDEHIAYLQSKIKNVATGSILVLIKREQSDSWAKVLEGIHIGAKEQGMKIQLYIVDESDYEGEDVKMHMAEDTIGIIFLCIFPIEFVKGLASKGLPMTFLNTPVNAQEYIELGDVYSLESFYAMSRVTSYCIEQRKCSTFGYIGFAEGSRVVQARYLGFLGVCKQYGIAVNGRYVFTRPQRGDKFTYDLVQDIINRMDVIPDCIICENDHIAMNVAMILLQKDAQLARRVTITGFDGIIPDDFFKKDIITVRVNMPEVGKRLVESVVNHHKNPERDIAFVTLATYPILERFS